MQSGASGRSRVRKWGESYASGDQSLVIADKEAPNRMHGEPELLNPGERHIRSWMCRVRPRVTVPSALLPGYFSSFKVCF